MDRFDFVAIGGGNTGLAAAARVAKAGKRVALVDRGPVGGLCSLAGCNPKKVLVRATEVLDEVRRAREHGIETGSLAVDWASVVARKASFTDPVPQQTESSLEKQGVTLIRGAARFVGEDRISVDGREIEATGFAVATGSRPRTLSFPGAEHTQRSDDILNLKEVPRRLCIIGAGVVACEFAFVFARLGSLVTVLVPRERILRDFDPEIVEPMAAFGESLGIRWWRKAKVESISRAGSDLLLLVAAADGMRRTLDADFVLNAAGRVPAIDDLALDRAGVRTGPRGIEVDGYLRSPSNGRIFAGGDAHGRFQLSPIASYEGRVIARNFLEGDVEAVDYQGVPRAVFLTPPLAAVGLGAEEARARGHDPVVAHNDMRGWMVFSIAGAEQAMARLVFDGRSRCLLGAQLWAASAPEMIHFFSLAVKKGVTQDELEEMIYAYPTATSAFRYAAR